MTVSIAYLSQVTATETIEDVFLDPKSKVVHIGMDDKMTLNADSTVSVVEVASCEIALSGGEGSVDLRALVGTHGGAVDGNGLKAQVVKLRSKATNANPITIASGASNGYLMLGEFSVTLLPGQHIQCFLNDAAPDVSGTTKILDLTGTDEEVLECFFSLG